MGKRMPGDFDDSFEFFGLFTWKDLTRLGLPGAVLAVVGQSATTTGMLVAVCVGILLGVIWYGVRPFGQPLEVYLYHRIRWIVFGGGKS